MPNVNGMVIKFQRGTKAQLNTFTLQLAEPGFTVDTKELYIGDGTDNILVGRVMVGLSTDRPVAGVEGRMYYSTDTGESWIDDGSAWQRLAVLSLSDLNGNLDDISDGITYVRILASETDGNGHVKQLNDGTNIISVSNIKNHIDNTNIHMPLDNTTHDDSHIITAAEVDRRIDAKINSMDFQDSVISFYDPTSGLPSSLNEGDRYIASATANGWTENNIYEYNNGSWTEIIPNQGFRLTVENVDKEYVFNSSGHWVEVSSTTNHNSLSGLQGGDLTNRWHLTYDQYIEATQLATDSLNGLMSATDHAKLPTSNQKDALQGTYGTPNDTNRYVTNDDPRMTNARTPSPHASTHQHGGSDEIATAVPAPNAIPKANAAGNLNQWIDEIDGGTFV